MFFRYALTGSYSSAWSVLGGDVLLLGVLQDINQQADVETGAFMIAQIHRVGLIHSLFYEAKT